MHETTNEAFLDLAFETAHAAAREVGSFLLENLGQVHSVTKKGRINLVTEMDLRAEEMIVERITRDFPDHEILTEEVASRSSGSPAKWIVDPLDGTTNYAHGYRFFAVSIALEVRGEVVLGVVYDPVVDEMFEARKGTGAYLNGQPIRVSRESRLEDAMLCTGFSYDTEQIRDNLRYFSKAVLEARAVRRDGSAALDLCYVACGRFDGFWEISLNPWDVAAGTLLIEEAGGQVSRLDGSSLSIYHPEVVSSNGKLHDALIELLSKA